LIVEAQIFRRIPTMNDHPRLTESLKSDVYELCRPEGRMVGTSGHATAERFVARRLE
jgi:hypothetical protein